MVKIIDGRKSRKLTPMQLRFVYEFCTKTLMGLQSASESARKAGYSDSAARRSAWELQDPKKYPLVAEAIYDMKKELADVKKAAKNVVAQSKDVVDAAKGNKRRGKKPTKNKKKTKTNNKTKK